MAQKILVLDDEENYAEMLESLLEQHFFIVDSATKPELALKALEQKGYDLVISDYKMPVMDGADFLQKAREINPDLPFIIVSGLMNTPELVKVANMGVTLVLEKPIDIENFIAQVKKFVSPVSEEEYARSRKAEDGASQPMGEGRKFIKTYPGDCQHVSDLSPPMQFFLQDVWDSVQEQNHVFVQTPIGSEIELLLAEVNRWRGSDAVPSLFLNAGAPSKSAAASMAKYRRRQERAPVVGITGFQGASMQSQESLVDVIREAPEEYTFIYFIDESLLKQDPPPINEELLELVQESLCYLPPLALRPTDLAVYAKRFLKALAEAENVEVPSGFSPEAVSQLLSHDWPGNLGELIVFLRIAVLRANGEEISGKLLQGLLEEAKSHETIELKARLRDAQGKLIAGALQRGGGSLANLLENTGVDTASIDGSTTAVSLDLLFPELATASHE